MTATWLRGDWMQTYTGRRFYPLDPRPDEIDAAEVADTRILLTERAALMARAERWSQDDLYQPLPVAIIGWPPAVAEARFLRRLEELTA